MPGRLHNSNVVNNHFASRALSNLVATLRFAVARACGSGRYGSEGISYQRDSLTPGERRCRGGEAAHTALHGSLNEYFDVVIQLTTLASGRDSLPFSGLTSLEWLRCQSTACEQPQVRVRSPGIRRWTVRRVCPATMSSTGLSISAHTRGPGHSHNHHLAQPSTSCHTVDGTSIRYNNVVWPCPCHSNPVIRITMAAANSMVVAHLRVLSNIGDRELGGGRRQPSDVAFCQVQCAFVFGAHGVVEEVGVAQAHLAGDVSEQSDQRLCSDTPALIRAVALVWRS